MPDTPRQDALPEILHIDGLSHDGRGLARHDGQVVFVAQGLPGQDVRVRLLRRQQRFLEMQATELVRPAPDAVPPVCPHGLECGGCPWQTMPRASQLEWKRRLLLDALERIGRLPRANLEPMLALPLASPQATGFRNKMEFAFGLDGNGRFRLGQRVRGSGQVLAVPHCALLPDGGMPIVDMAGELAHASGLAPYTPPARRSGRRAQAGRQDDGFWRFFVLHHVPNPQGSNQQGNDCWFARIVTSPQGKKGRVAVQHLAHGLLAAFPALEAVLHEESDSIEPLARGKGVAHHCRHGAAMPSLRMPLLERTFTLAPGMFFQVNTQAAALLAQTARDFLPAQNCAGHALLDLYCGVGAPGLLLAGQFNQVFGIEADGGAVASAAANARDFGLDHCRYAAGPAEQLIQALVEQAQGAQGQRWQTVLADPPRAGLGAGVCGALLALAPRQILYISCNPATLARDVASLAPRYTVTRLAAVDMFPHTPHVESLCLLAAR